MGMKSIGAVAAAGLALMLGGAGFLQPTANNVDRAVTEPSNNQNPQRKANAAVALAAREDEIAARRLRGLWATLRYRRDGKHRSAGDRAHKRLKAARRSGR